MCSVYKYMHLYVYMYMCIYMYMYRYMYNINFTDQCTLLHHTTCTCTRTLYIHGNTCVEHTSLRTSRKGRKATHTMYTYSVHVYMYMYVMHARTIYNTCRILVVVSTAVTIWPLPSSSVPVVLSAFLMKGSLRESLKLLLRPLRASFSDEARLCQQHKDTNYPIVHTRNNICSLLKVSCILENFLWLFSRGRFLPWSQRVSHVDDVVQIWWTARSSVQLMHDARSYNVHAHACIHVNVCFTCTITSCKLIHVTAQSMSISCYTRARHRYVQCTCSLYVTNTH